MFCFPPKNEYCWSWVLEHTEIDLQKEVIVALFTFFIYKLNNQQNTLSPALGWEQYENENKNMGEIAMNWLQPME